ncbi:DinB family protein [Flagellimonas crocea]|uniref:DinB family protein n=1 Tax=Flagellimonas crocea TaxID=3067311 RepID=UPI00296F18A7|nr:DinB family protein [Muricauda sp. DH64]
MKNNFLFQFTALLFILTAHSNLKAQEMDLPYKEIPEYPSDYGSGNLVSRMIDGLGFRYYWATEGLTEKDLAFKPSEDGRSLLETMEHIYVMSNNISLAPDAKPYERPENPPKYSYQELRSLTLKNLRAASSKVLGTSSEEMENFKVIFKQGDKTSEFPYWNMINGMISDCIHHTGQIVLMRRASGNPQNPNVNVFLGKTRE